MSVILLFYLRLKKNSVHTVEKKSDVCVMLSWGEMDDIIRKAHGKRRVKCAERSKECCQEKCGYDNTR